MFLVLATAWRVVIKRAVADRLILIAALITIVLATTLVAAGPIYADAVSLSGAQRALADAPVADVNLEISARTPTAGFAAASEFIADEIPAALDLTGGALYQSVTSGSFQLPHQSSDQIVDLAAFRYLRGVDEHASLIRGRWPGTGGQPIETAVSSSTAALLGITIGDELVLTSRADGADQPVVRVVGVFDVDPDDPYWFEDPLSLDGVTEGRSFRTFGPFVVALEPLLAGLSQNSVQLSWRAFPDYENLEVDHVVELRNRVADLQDRLGSVSRGGITYLVETRIPDVLGDIERSVRATRTGVLTLTLQLAILAGYALVLTAGLLVESRRRETSLLRSRGASTGQVFAMAVMEGVALTVPAALAAPWLASVGLRALNRVGPLTSIGLVIDPVVTPSSYALAFLAAAGCVGVLSIPALRSARPSNESYVARGRQEPRGLVQRAGIDLALLVVAAVLLWQLRRFGGDLSATVQRRFGIDPLLIGAPAIAMLAGAVVALRSIPLLARLAERAAALGPSAVRALAAWQVARRPRRHARAALLLILALAIGVFAAGYTSTWKQSQADQADHQVGADLRIVPDRRLSVAIPELNLYDAHHQLDAVVESMAVARASGGIGRAESPGRFVMIDARRAGDIVTIRDDLGSRPFAELMDELAGARPALATVPVAGEPRRIGVDVSVVVDPLPDDFEKPAIPNVDAGLEFTPSARIVIQDGHGLLHRLDLGPVPVDSGPVRLVADLGHVMSNGVAATPDYPVAVVAVELVSPTPSFIARTATVTIGGLVAGPGTDAAWEPVEADLTSQRWQLTHTGLSRALTRPAISYPAEQPEDGLSFVVDSGAGVGPVVLPVYYGIRPAGPGLPERFPVLVSDRFLADGGGVVGDEVQLSGLPYPTPTAYVAGSVASFPTVAPAAGEAVVIDLPTIQMLSYEAGEPIATVDERWIQVRAGESAAVAAELAAAPYETPTILDRAAQAEAFQLDPVALGTIGSLALGFVAAAVFAAAGFAVSAVVSARERLTEFALLRAVGLSPRQLADWLSLEHGVLVAVSLVFGSVIGVLLIWIIVPLITLTQDAAAAVPAVLPVYPWATIIRLELVLVAVLAVVVVVLVAALRRGGLGSLLRLGED